MKYSKEDIEKNNALYQTFLHMQVDDGWTYSDKIGNFELLTRIADYADSPLSRSTVLDVGCGTGDLYEYLLQFEDVAYTGVDIFEKGIEKAKVKFPNGLFLVGDFLDLNLTPFDYVFSSGAMTTKLDNDNYQILFSWVKKMWKLAKKGVVFNLLLERYPGDYSNSLFVYNRQKVLELTAKAASSARMKVIVTDAGSGDGTEELHVYLF